MLDQVPEFLNYFRGEVYDAKGVPSKTVPISMLDPKVVQARLPFYNSMAGSYGLNNTGLSNAAPIAAQAAESYRLPTESIHPR